MATVLELLIQTMVHCRSGRPLSSKVFNPKGGSNRCGVPVGVAVDIGVFVGVSVDVPVGICVGVLVGVSVAVPVAVGVGVSVGVSVATGVEVLVGVSVAVAVEVGVGVSVGVSVGVPVAVSVGVLVGVSVGVLVAVLVGVDVGLRTVTVFVLVLFVSFPSGIWLSGSTVTVLDRLPGCEDVTGKLISNESPEEKVTALLAIQVRDVPVIEQSIVPSGAVLPLVIVTGPWG
jgi:hypothetical protein